MVLGFERVAGVVAVWMIGVGVEGGWVGEIPNFRAVFTKLVNSSGQI